MLISGQGLAEFAWGEVERAQGSLEGSGMEHTGLSVCLSVGLIKGLAKKALHDVVAVRACGCSSK